MDMTNSEWDTIDSVNLKFSVIHYFHVFDGFQYSRFAALSSSSSQTWTRDIEVVNYFN